MTDEKKTPTTARPVVQKAFRLTLAHDIKLARLMQRLRGGEPLPAVVTAHLTEGRELCESDVVGAAIAHLEGLMSAWPEPTKDEA